MQLEGLEGEVGPNGRGDDSVQGKDAILPEELSFVADVGGGVNALGLFVTRGGMASTVQIGPLTGNGPHSAVWSPDGTRVAVGVLADEDDRGDSIVDSDSGLFVLGSDGRELWRISPTGVRPAWSPDGLWIAYMDNDGEWIGDAGGFNVYVVQADGAGVPQTVGYGCCPDWSPDGARIMYSIPTGPATRGLAVAELGGGGGWTVAEYQYPFGPDGPPVGFQEGSWSPDGRQIAYTFGWEIHVVNADGSGARHLISGEEFLHQPTWSPDGRMIAYVSGEDASWKGGDDSRRLWVADAAGGTSELLSDAQSWDPVWSPDSTRLAYIASVGGAPGEIMVASVEDRADAIAVSPPNSDSPTWSWDSTRLAFSSPGNALSNPEGDLEIFVVDADGGNLVQVTDNAHDDFMPQWIAAQRVPLPAPTISSPSDVERTDPGGASPMERLNQAETAEEVCREFSRVASDNAAHQDARHLVREQLGSEWSESIGLTADTLSQLVVGVELLAWIIWDECEYQYSSADAFRISYWQASVKMELGYLLTDRDFTEEELIITPDLTLSHPVSIGTWSTPEELRYYCDHEVAVALRDQAPGWRDLIFEIPIGPLTSEYADRESASGIGMVLALVNYLCEPNWRSFGPGQFPEPYFATLTQFE